jgi:hypothetical protein
MMVPIALFATALALTTISFRTSSSPESPTQTPGRMGLVELIEALLAHVESTVPRPNR